MVLWIRRRSRTARAVVSSSRLLPTSITPVLHGVAMRRTMTWRKMSSTLPTTRTRSLDMRRSQMTVWNGLRTPSRPSAALQMRLRPLPMLATLFPGPPSSLLLVPELHPLPSVLASPRPLLPPPPRPQVRQTLRQSRLTPLDLRLPWRQPRPPSSLAPTLLLRRTRKTRKLNLHPSTRPVSRLDRARQRRPTKETLSQKHRPARLPLAPLPLSLRLLQDCPPMPTQHSLPLRSARLPRLAQHRSSLAPTRRRRPIGPVLCLSHPSSIRRRSRLATWLLSLLRRRLLRSQSTPQHPSSLRLVQPKLP